MASARKEFNIRIDGDNPDSLLKRNLKELRIDQLNRKVNFLFFIIIILICALIVVAYFDIKGRISENDSEKTATMEKTIANLSGQYDSLSKQHDQMKTSVANRLEALEKNDIGLTEEVAKAQKNLNLMSSSKMGKHDLKQINAKIDQSIATVQDEIQTVSSQIKALDKNFKQELFLLAASLDKFKTESQALSQTVADHQKKLNQIEQANQAQQENLIQLIDAFEAEKGEWNKLSKLIIRKTNEPVELPDSLKQAIQAVNQLQADLVDLAQTVVYRKTLDAALARNQKKQQQNLKEMEQDLIKRITTLQKEFLIFEKKLSAQTLSPQPRTPPSTKDGKTGTIFEQDIQ